MSDTQHLQSVETEQALLGAMLVKPALAQEISAIVGADHFSDPLHSRIFATMSRLSSEGRAVTPETLAPYFAGDANVGAFTVRQYFGRLAAAVKSLLAAPELARTVRELAVRRELHGAGLLAQQFAGDMERTPAEAAAAAIAALDGIVAGAHLARKTRVDAIDAADRLLYDIENGCGELPVPTGLADLDSAIGGLYPGEYHILAGRPSMGKTALAETFALNAARRGFGTMFFSLEMRTETIMARMMSDLVYNSQTPVPYRDILRHKADPQRMFLNEHQIWRLKEAREHFERMPLVIDDQSNLSAAEISARARRQASRFREKGFDLKLVVIDHKDFVRAGSRYTGNKVAETGEISASLKSMFKELGVAGLLLCQLSRDVEKRDNKRPDLPDLRWAGDLEQDADVVMFSYRESYYLERGRLDDASAEADRQDALDKCRRNFEVIIGKQRNGPRMTVDLWADMANNAIRNKLKH